MKKRVAYTIAAMAMLTTTVTGSAAATTTSNNDTLPPCSIVALDAPATYACTLSSKQAAQVNAKLSQSNCGIFNSPSVKRNRVACGAKRFAEDINLTPTGYNVKCVWFSPNNNVTGFTFAKKSL